MVACRYLVVFSLLLFLSASGADAATFFVSKTGSDQNSGSQASPWLTVQKAANTLAAGDTVHVQPGTYEERVAQSIDGTSIAPITFVADGAVVIRGFHITADYIRVIGFEVTHTVNVGYPGFRISGTTGVQILDNYIHHTSSDGDSSGLSFGNSQRLLVRGNTFYLMNSPGGGDTALGDTGKCVGDIFGQTANMNVVVEYNKMSRTTDFFCPAGQRILFRNNMLGPLFQTDFSAPHTDAWQSNQETHYGWSDSNWHVDCSITDSHIMLIEAPVSGRSSHISVINNVSLRSGDQLWFQMRDGQNLYAAHNTVGQVGYGPKGGPGSSGFIYVWSDRNGPSTGDEAYNNLYSNVTTGKVYEVLAGSSLTHHHDLVWPAATDLVSGTNGDLEADPQFTNYQANETTLQATSPGVDSGGPLTTVISASGTGTTFTVANPDWFYDTMGGVLAEGRRIYVGDDNNLAIASVDYNARTVTVTTPFSWSANDSVGFAYRGIGPDRGAYEYGDTLLTSAILAHNGNLYTVTPTGDARFVVFYSDKIPVATVAAPPYTATISTGVVTAKVFARHPQANAVVTASTTAASAPRSPTNLQVR